MAEASVHVMNLDIDSHASHTEATQSHINVGTGEDVTIRELAETVMRTVGFQGELQFDASKPDGTPRKLLDVSTLARMGWHAKVKLEAGLQQTYRDFLNAPEIKSGASIVR